MSVVVTYSTALTVAETLESTPAATDANSLVTHNVFNKAVVLNSGSTPPATKVASFEVAMTAGAATIDLEALTGTEGVFSGAGLKVQAAKFINKAGNANPITIKTGVANGYDGFGSALAGLSLAVEAEVQLFTNDGGADISSTNSDIDITGTGSEILQVELVLG